MSDGVFVGVDRPKTKKAFKEAVTKTPERVRIELTSLFSGGGTLNLEDLEMGKRYDLVGPDPHKDRKWYATVTRTATGYKLT